MGKKRTKLGSDNAKQIRLLLLSGMRTKDIERKFEMTVKGIKWHIGEIFKEEGVKNRHEFMAKYLTVPKHLSSESPEKYGQLPLVPFKAKKEVDKVSLLKTIEASTRIHLPMGGIQ